jgi:hypothetical protein
VPEETCEDVLERREEDELAESSDGARECGPRTPGPAAASRSIPREAMSCTKEGRVVAIAMVERLQRGR